MKQTLQLKLSQHLALTPQLQQSIRLLQLSTLELDQEIEHILLENPMLEREDQAETEPHTTQEPSLFPEETPPSQINTEFETEKSLDADISHEPDLIDWDNSGNDHYTSSDDELPDHQNFQAAEISLRDHLNQQIALSPFSDRDRVLVRFLIEALDHNGYLQQPLEELLDLIPNEYEVSPNELQIALNLLQSLDPVGIGARTPQECLSLQLRTLDSSETCELAIKIVEDHLTLLAERNFTKLKKMTGANNEKLRAAQHLILSLNPRPGSRFATNETHYIVPDVIAIKKQGKWTVRLNQEAMPRLRVNQLYANILQQHRGESGSLSTQLQEARWLIKNVQQRFETILRVSKMIVHQQKQFFEHGEVAMRPMTLRDIAERLNLHESTISRVTTKKFMATPRGIFELKYFFGSHVATEVGGAASSTAIRALIRQLVDNEEKKKPLSDAKLAELLGEQGIVIARRTVAKYRELLNIPSVSLRKSI